MKRLLFILLLIVGVICYVSAEAMTRVDQEPVEPMPDDMANDDLIPAGGELNGG